MEREFLVPIADLQFFEFHCPRCSTGFTVDMARDEVRFPETCPSCGETWNSFTGVLPQAFIGYKQFYRAFSKAEKVKPQFRIKEKEQGL